MTPEAPPTLVGGRYRVLGWLGSGATGTVFVAEDQELGRKVAVKRLADHLAADPVYLRRFREEARIMAQVDHPNVVRVYSLHEGPEGALMIVEYVEGASLRQVVANSGRLGPEQTMGMLSGALSGLARAHALGVVHRDIKPENVLADRNGVSKLADFGQAVDGVTPLSEAAMGLPTGTPAYISPEAGRGALTDARSDIYSAGAMTFEILTGRPPFVADNPMALVRLHITEAPPDARKVDPSTAPAVAALLQRSMAKDPEARFQTVDEFMTALGAAAEESYGTDWRSRSAIAALVTSSAGAVAGIVAAALPTAAAAEAVGGSASMAVGHGVVGQSAAAAVPPGAAVPAAPPAAVPAAAAPPVSAPATPPSSLGRGLNQAFQAPARAAASHAVRNAVAAAASVAVVAGGAVVVPKLIAPSTQQQTSSFRLEGSGGAHQDGVAVAPFCGSVELDYNYHLTGDANTITALNGRLVTVRLTSTPAGAPSDGGTQSAPVGPDGKVHFAFPHTGVPKGGAVWTVSQVTLDGRPLDNQQAASANAKC